MLFFPSIIMSIWIQPRIALLIRRSLFLTRFMFEFFIKLEEFKDCPLDKERSNEYNEKVLSKGILAQLGEHLPYKQRVIGSSPIGPIFMKTLEKR